MCVGIVTSGETDYGCDGDKAYLIAWTAYFVLFQVCVQ